MDKRCALLPYLYQSPLLIYPFEPLLIESIKFVSKNFIISMQIPHNLRYDLSSHILQTNFHLIKLSQD